MVAGTQIKNIKKLVKQTNKLKCFQAIPFCFLYFEEKQIRAAQLIQINNLKKCPKYKTKVIFKTPVCAQ